MAHKTFFVILAIIILCLSCGMCLATEEKSVDLGNEIMDSIDKTGKSINNVVSGNVIKDTGNGVKNGVEKAENMVKDGVKDVGNTVNNGIKDVNQETENKYNDNKIVNREVNGNYNTVRTETTATGINSGLQTMTTTTWMWIILVVAAVIIIAAIWYYATQNNS